MIFDSKYERDKSFVIILLHNIFNLVAEHCKNEKVSVTTFGVNFTTNVGHYTVVNMIISDDHYQLVVTFNTC